MNVYRHKETKKLYIIEHLILDIHHLNRNKFAGIYANPYNWKGDNIIFQSGDKEKCKIFVDENFEIASNK